jgi:hypothetical protein
MGTMGLSWQQGPLASGAAGRLLVPQPVPERPLYAEPRRRRMRVRLGGAWIADSADVVLLHEPGRYPVAYFPLSDVYLDGARLRLARGQSVIAHGPDRELSPDELGPGE